MAKCKLESKKEASCVKVKKLFKKILILAEDKDDKIKQENDIKLLEELLKKANNDNYEISATQAQELIKFNLLQQDGTIEKEDKEIILSCLFFDRETIYVEIPVYMEETDMNVYGDLSNNLD